MKKFIITIVLFSIAFFLIEKLLYVFLLVSPSLEYDQRLEKVINGEMNKDLIVLGSSRGAHNIIAGQIGDSLNISAYNLSYPGSDIEFHEFILQSVIKFNKTPKIVLLALDDPSELLPSESISFRLDRLYPLAKYDYINDEMINRNEKSILSYFLVAARMNKTNFDIRKKHVTDVDTIADCGSMPISFQRKEREYTYENTTEKYDVSEESQRKVESFLKLQKLCTENKIKLYLVFPPNFRKHSNSFEKRMKQLANSDVSFLFYNPMNKVYQDKTYFYDEAHLRKNGAVIFTNELINQLNTK